MRIIPVLDLKGGQAVHAVAGDRARYRPLVSRYHPEPDPVGIARGLRDEFGATEVYVADLDAIINRAAPELATFRALADLGLTVWADAGSEDTKHLALLLGAGVARVVVGLESIRGPAALAAVVAQAGQGRVVFSLDLRAGVPIIASGATWAGDPTDAANLVAQAVTAGVRSVIRLDLATVGTGRGVAGIPSASATWPGVEWITGGGVAGPEDLAAVARLGYAAVLVGSAVHDGRIEPRMNTDGTRIEEAKKS